MSTLGQAVLFTLRDGLHQRRDIENEGYFAAAEYR